MKSDYFVESIVSTTCAGRGRSVRGLALLAMLCASVASGLAATTWDANPGSSGAQDGAGTWDAVTANWWNGSSDAVWPNTTSTTATIGAGSGAAGTITVNGSVILNAIQFAAAGSGQYTLTNGTLAFAGTTPAISISSGTPTIQSTIAGTTPMAINFGSAASSITLGTNSTYDGQTTISGSGQWTLNLYSLNSIASPLACSSLGRPTTAANGTIVIASGGFPYTVKYLGTGETCDRTINLAGGFQGAFVQSGTGKLKFTGNFTSTGNTVVNGLLQLNGTTTAPAEISGNISNAVNGTVVSVNTSGTWILSGNNSFNGGVTINAGTLRVDGQSSPNSGTGSGAVSLNFGQLNGNGRIAGAVTLLSGGANILYPNNGGGTNGHGGTLTIGGNLTIGAACPVKFDLTSRASGTNDQVVLENKVLACNSAVISINSAGTLDTTDYVLFNVGASGTISGTFNATPIWLGTAPANHSLYVITNISKTVVLHYKGSAPVPITVTAVGNNKVYDGTTSAVAMPVITSGSLASGDTGNFVETYDTATVGAGKTLTPSGTIKDSGNNDVTSHYNITFVPTNAGVIYPVGLAFSLASSANPAGYRDSLSFAATLATSGTLLTNATGNVVFETNGVPFSTNSLANGVAMSMAVNGLPRATTNVAAAIYSGDGNYSSMTNTLIQTVTNHSPVANTAYFTRSLGVPPLEIPFATLLANVTDMDGDLLVLTGVSNSTNGIAVTANNTYVLYQGGTNNITDTFNYTVSDAQGGSATGMVVILKATWPTGLLSNPGFELDDKFLTASVIGWQKFGNNVLSGADAGMAHSGTNYLQVAQASTGRVNDNGVYQDYISAPGAVYNADGWAYAPNVLAGQNVAWIEVTFRDATANVLALYRSGLISASSTANNGAFPNKQWNDLLVANQYNPTTGQITNMAAQLVAPPGTFFVRYQIVFQGDGGNSAGSAYFDDLNLTQIGGAPYGNLNIVWSDEFNGNIINSNVWTYDTGSLIPSYNGELEYYTSNSSNSFVTNGCLHIVARQESMGGSSYTSARLKTQGLFGWQFGRFVWHAKLPAGAGTWPALWMMGTNNSTISWPGCGEIDVMENIGNDPLTVYGSLHSGSDESASYKLIDGSSVTNFHAYTIDWTTNAILFYVDGHLYETQTNWASTFGAYPFPFNKPFFLLMNLAIGGSWPGSPNTNTIFPSEMLVDYVRIYSATGPFKITMNRTGSNILLAWPSNIVCHLEAQTNSQVAGISTNWFPVTTATNPIPITVGSGSAFYRLASP